jgi:hypothetical protein
MKDIKELEKKYKIGIMIASKDRHSEVALLLQSLRTSTFKNFNIYILDDGSGTPITSAHFIGCVINRMKLEGIYINVLRNSVSLGVSYARQFLCDELNKSKEGENLALRLDDDCIVEPDYIEKLLEVIEQGYDMASGIVPLIATPEIKRQTKFIKPILNKVEFNDLGDMTCFGDDCGYSYLTGEIIPAHHFRTNLLYKIEINKKIKYENGLSPVGFREESFFSLRCAWEKYKLGVHTGAKAFHLQTPSGGCRHTNYAELVRQDDEKFRAWAKDVYLTRGDPFDS